MLEHDRNGNVTEEKKGDALLENLVWIRLEKPFLVVKETLRRMGIASKKEDILYQSCHILHKRGRYAILHFKELFLLDGKPSDFSENDKARRNTIVNLLVEWGLVSLDKPDSTKEPAVPVSAIKIISSADKKNWTLVSKHSIEKNKTEDETNDKAYPRDLSYPPRNSLPNIRD